MTHTEIAAKAAREYLTITRCPLHGYYAVIIDSPNGGGTRLTPSKCCGRWADLKKFRMSARDWREMARLAREMAQIAEVRK